MFQTIQLFSVLALQRAGPSAAATGPTERTGRAAAPLTLLRGPFPSSVGVEDGNRLRKRDRQIWNTAKL
jgi:hypothetical protein